MFKFKADQKVYDIGNVKVGGELGENPTVLIGSIFYLGDKLVLNENEGLFDRNNATALIREVEDLSRRTGLPAMIDVVCSTGKVAVKYIEFVAETTEMPILLDAVTEEAAIKGLECAKELDVIERTIFNSITPETRDLVFEKIKEVGLDSAILLTYSSRAIISSELRIKLLEKMVPKVSESGITKPLIDTVVVDISTLGLACKAISEVKNKYGYPAGCGAHNAVGSWKNLKEKSKEIKVACSTIVNCLPVAIGADFILYGPLKTARYIFPAVGIIDASYGQLLMERGKRPNLEHPRFKISRF